MPEPQSHGGMNLIWDGERVTEFADEDPPVEFEPMTLGETTRGMDGAMYIRGTNQVGTRMTVKLLPTAKQVKKWMLEHARIQNGDWLRHRGSYGDPRLGTSTQIEGAYMVGAPAAIPPGVTAEFIFECERVIPDYANARF